MKNLYISTDTEKNIFLQKMTVLIPSFVLLCDVSTRLKNNYICKEK